MEKKYKIEVSIAEIETICQALSKLNFSIKLEVLNELSKQAMSQAQFNSRFNEIMESSVSYQLEEQLRDLLNAIYEEAI